LVFSTKALLEKMALEAEKTRLFALYVQREMQTKQVTRIYFFTTTFICRFLDREYRKGVHWLETLRLRRTKILESGYKVRLLMRSELHSLKCSQSLEMFVEESSTVIKKALEKYTDNMTYGVNPSLFPLSYGGQ
jgi:hypothetical protein